MNKRILNYIYAINIVTVVTGGVLGVATAAYGYYAGVDPELARETVTVLMGIGMMSGYFYMCVSLGNNFPEVEERRKKGAGG